MEKVRTDKRLRLIEAANTLIYQHGFSQTTLADIARKSEVPLGNVYYYFKTKNELGNALIEHRADSYRGLIDAWNQLPDPRRRILSLIQMVLDQRENLAQNGCPVGSLCQELNKHGGPLAEKSATLLAAMLDWIEQQFRELGKGEKSPDLALYLVSVLQGASLLTHAFKKPDLIAREAKLLKDWVNAL